MTDREKVIEGLELCIEQGLSDGADCRKCPYYTTSARLTCWIILLYNAHELLKEQDAVERVRRGKWIKKRNIMLGEYFECSLCKNVESRIAPGWWNAKSFCPQCNARMEKGD